MSKSNVDWSDLPEEVKKYFDSDTEIEFESFADSSGQNVMPVSAEEYSGHRLRSAQKMLKHRRYTEEMKRLYDRYESGELTTDEAEKLMTETTHKFMSM